MEKFRRAFSRSEEAVKNAKPTQVFANVSAHISERLTQELLDDFYIRQQRDWGKIANKVFGAEF